MSRRSSFLGAKSIVFPNAARRAFAMAASFLKFSLYVAAAQRA